MQPLSGDDAAELFIARVRAVRRDVAVDEQRATVEAICARLDGLPLAIELAADRARLLPLPTLLERLDARLELLTAGPRDLPERQRSLRATLEWSWEVLEEPEERLLGRLTVFEGGASLEAAEAVCGPGLGGGVEALVSSVLEKCSQLRAGSDRDGRLRLTMLDTVREFAVERATGRDDLAVCERRHAGYFLDYCERAAERAARAVQREWLDRLAQERGNIRVAFERLLSRGATSEALRLAIAFARALPWDAHAHRVRGWLGEALAAGGEVAAQCRAQGLYWAGMLALSQARFADAQRQLEAALATACEAREPDIEAAALCALGRRAALVAAPDAVDLCEEAVQAARRTAEPILIADALLALAGACERTLAWERAGKLVGEALELYRAAGDAYGAAAALAELGWNDLVHGRLQEADRRLEDALELRRRHGDDRRLVEPLIDHAWLLLARGDGGAGAAFLDCLTLARHVGEMFIIGEALAGLSAQAALDARFSEAARLAGASAGVHEQIGAPPWASVGAMQDRALTRAQEALGRDYAAEFDDGRRLSPEEVVALSTGGPPTMAASGAH